MSTFRILVGLAAVVIAALCTPSAATQQASVETRPPNATGQMPAFAGQTRVPERKANVAYEVVPVAEGLEFPWGMAFLPDGRLLVSEKPGRLRVITTTGTLSAPLAGVLPVDARG